MHETTQQSTFLAIKRIKNRPNCRPYR
jgi:hypothetical protein